MALVGMCKEYYNENIVSIEKSIWRVKYEENNGW